MHAKYLVINYIIPLHIYLFYLVINYNWTKRTIKNIKFLSGLNENKNSVGERMGIGKDTDRAEFTRESPCLQLWRQK